MDRRRLEHVRRGVEGVGTQLAAAHDGDLCTNGGRLHSILYCCRGSVEQWRSYGWVRNVVAALCRRAPHSTVIKLSCGGDVPYRVQATSRGTNFDQGYV